MTSEQIALLVGGILTALAGLNEKVRNVFLGRSSFKNKTTEATDETLERMMNRINSLSEDFVKLNESNINTQKENYEQKQKILNLENECENMKNIIKQRCNNGCFV